MSQFKHDKVNFKYICKHLNQTTKMKVKAENLISSNGNPVPNQFRITTNKWAFFQSYSSIIVHVAKDGSITLDEKYWDYSNTTRKYRNIFLRMDSKQIKDGIKSGKIKFKNLN